MEHNLENIKRVIEKMANNRYALYEYAKEHYPVEAVETKNRLCEASELFSVLRLIEDKQWFDEMCGIYEVTE